jgi:hypothetical protein
MIRKGARKIKQLRVPETEENELCERVYALLCAFNAFIRASRPQEKLHIGFLKGIST